MKVCPPLTFATRLPAARTDRGFTLVEMLVVMGIILILFSLVVPATTSMLKGNALTQGGQDVSNQLGVARQLSLTQNHPIEVRFYQYGDPSKAGESATDPATGWKFRALQTFAISEAGVATPIDKIHKLPNAVIIDSGATLSTLIGNASAGGTSSGGTAAGSGPVLTTSPQTVLLPDIGKYYNSVAFRFFPDGSTNLPLAAGATVNSWFLTVHGYQDGDNPGTVPPNFLTIQIDPSNGNTREFRH